VRTLGIDIGGSSVKAAMLDGELVTTARSAGYANPSREGLIHAVQEAVHLLGEPIDRTVPVGLCLPGKQSASGDRVVHSINLPCLNDWVFSEMLGSMLGFQPERSRFVSDIHATAIDLISRYELHGRVGVIAIGTGVGFVMIEDGQVLKLGSKGVGHLGQLDVGRCDDADRIDPSGVCNPLEAFVGIRAIRDRLGMDDESAILEYLESIPDEDPCMRALVRAMRVVHAIHTPDTIVLAGGVGIALQSRCDVIRTLVNEGLTTLANREWRLVFGDSLYHAAVGAARLAKS
jgi:predicted NBD/HSP70 family sugar kinase